MTKNIIFTQSRMSTDEVELAFTKMLAARLIAGEYFSEFDREAIQALSSAHSQDKSTLSLKRIALASFESLNPGYEYRD